MYAKDDVVEEARRWIGTRYRHQGRNKNGLDCSGLIVVVMRELHYPWLPTHGAYGVLANEEEFRYHLTNCFDRVPNESLQEGDIMFFRFHKAFRHVGIYAGLNRRDDPQMIHSMSKRKVHETWLNEKWMDRWGETYRWRFDEWQQLRSQ